MSNQTITTMDIKSALNNIQKEEETIKKIGKFLKTKKGTLFVSKLYTAPLKELCDRYEAPKYLRLYKNDRKDKNLIKAAITKYNITIPGYKPVITGTATIVKLPVRLTKKEIREIEAKRPKKMGRAALMHALEEHKMKKFENSHKLPEQDLFAEEFKAQIKTQLYIHREYVRNFISRAYYNVDKREPFYRLFLVYENKATGGTYEKEGDPYVVGYPFCTCTERTPLEKLKDILRNRAKTIRDSECLELKLYTKYGNLLACSKTQSLRHYQTGHCRGQDGSSIRIGEWFDSAVSSNQRILVSLW